MGLTVAELQAVVAVDEAPLDEGLSGMLGSIGSWGGKAGAAFASAGALSGGLFAAGVMSAMGEQDVAADFESSLGTTHARAGELGTAAGDLYAQNFGESVADVGTAMESVVTSIDGMRDANADAVEDMTMRAMTFADTMEIDVARAAQVAGGMLHSGLAEDGVEAFDLLMAASQRVPAALREDVLDAVDEYGGFASQIGLDGEQMFALLVRGAEQGTYGIDKTGDAIAEFAKLVTGDLARTEPVIEGLGLNYADMANALVAGGDQAADATSQIVDGLLGIEDPAAQTRAALELFGTPLEDLGTDKIPEFLTALQGGSDAMGDYAGTVDDAAEAVGSTASAQFSTFFRTLKRETIDVIGGYAIPMVTDFAGALNKHLGPSLAMAKDYAVAAGDRIRAFAGWVQENEKPIRIVAGVIGAVYLPLLIAMGVQATVAAAATVIGFALSATSAAASAAVASVSIAVWVAGWVLMGATALIQAARIAAAWFIALGPIGWVIAAVVGLVALIVWKFDEIKAVIGFVWDWVSSKTSAVWGSITGWIADRVTAILGFVAGLSALPGRVGGYFGDMKDAAIAKAVELVTWMMGLPGDLMDAAGDFGTMLYDAGRELIAGLIRGIRNKFDDLGNAMGAVGSLIGGFLPGSPVKTGPLTSWNNGGAGKRLMGFLVDGIEAGRRDVRAVMGDVADDVDDPMFGGGGALLAAAGSHVPARSAIDGLISGSGVRTPSTPQASTDSSRLVEAHFHGSQDASAREIVDELAFAMRAGQYGGVYSAL